MIIARTGKNPWIAGTATIAASASIIGDVRIGNRCYIDHHVVIESAGPSIDVGDEVIVFAGTVIRSVGGSSRPPFPIAIGSRTVVAPHCTLTGCRIGHHCYVATASIVLQGAVIGDASRIGVGAIVHAKTLLPHRARVGMRHMAVPRPGGFISTADVDVARQAVGDAAFFETAFGLDDTDQAALHEHVIDKLLEEVHGWRDTRV